MVEFHLFTLSVTKAKIQILVLTRIELSHDFRTKYVVLRGVSGYLLHHSGDEGRFLRKARIQILVLTRIELFHDFRTII